MQMHKSDMWIS